MYYYYMGDDVDGTGKFMRDVDEARSSGRYWGLVLRVIEEDGADKMQWLLDNTNIDIDYIHPTKGSALCIAASLYSTDVALVLLEANANVNARDSSGHTPLHLLIMNLYQSRYSYMYDSMMSTSSAAPEAMFRLLLWYGADIDARDHWGDTALHVAARVGEVFVVKNLLRCGARRGLYSENFNGLTALDVAKQTKGRMDSWYDPTNATPFIHDEETWRAAYMSDVKGSPAPDFVTSLEHRDRLMYIYIRKTIYHLEGAQESWNRTVKRITSGSYSDLPDDILRGVFDEVMQPNPTEFPKSLFKIFESMRRRKWIKRIGFRYGIVRRILDPNGEFPSDVWGVKEHWECVEDAEREAYEMAEGDAQEAQEMVEADTQYAP